MKEKNKVRYEHLNTRLIVHCYFPPLSTGHEFPFSIQMSHLREPLDETGEQSDEITPPERQMELLFEQLQSDSQCQFILRPSRVAVGHSFVGKCLLTLRIS